MQPIGLAFKKQKPKRYSTQPNGELMIVHLCLNCGKIATNRIAGDDNSYTILNVFDHSLSLEENIKIKIANLSIRLLTPEDKEPMLTSLFGKAYSQFIK